MSRTRTAGTVLVAMTALAALHGVAYAGSDDAAHALADKFAGVGAAPRKPAAEASRSEQVRSNAQVRDERLRAEKARTADDERAEAERRRAARLKADEAEMLARARAEAEAARQEALKTHQVQQALEAPSNEAPQPATEPMPAGIAEAPHETAEEMEARRQAESDALAVRLRRARAALAAAKHLRPSPKRAAPTAAAPSHETPAEAEAPVHAAPPAPTPVVAPDDIETAATSRVTVLLLIDHGTRGIRRFDPAGDPILCIERDCFIGAGAGRPAVRLRRAKAFGPVNTLGRRAGACSHSLTCVLRDVDLGGPVAVLQPVDLRLVHHDRRDPVQVRGDSDCTLVSGRLSCRFAVKGRDWRAWIVPEKVAASAGPNALQLALDGGLQPSQSASAAGR